MEKRVVSPRPHLPIPFLFQMSGSDGISYILDTGVGFLFESAGEWRWEREAFGQTQGARRCPF